MSRKTPQDPTGQARNRNRGTARLSVRLTNAERKIKALFRSVPRSSRRQTSITNAEQKAIFDYDYDPVEFERLVKFEINTELLQTQTDVMPFDWYWKQDVELPYRQGTVEEVRDFNQLIASAIAAGVLIGGLPPQEVPIEQVLLSEPYRAELTTVQARNFSTIKSLSDNTAAQVMQRINSAVQAGESPSVVAKEISERFDVSRSSAKRIAETEINRAYNDAKMDATELMAERTGLRAAVIHISALAPTTRSTHAARHGNTYTVADQRSWWNTSPNRINCKCATESVLIDRQGNVVQADRQQEIKARRA